MYAVVLVIWAALVLILTHLAAGRHEYGRRVTDSRKRKDDPPQDQYMGLSFVAPFMALYRKWNGEERRDHERRSGA